MPPADRQRAARTVSGPCPAGAARALLRAAVLAAAGAAAAAAPAAPPPASGPAPAAPAERPYDPRAGIEESGRIPKVELPPDLEHPERWRYIPEGRIKPGNVLERFLVTTFIAPFVFFDEEVGFGGGVAITDIDFRTQRRREFAGIALSYTTEGQQRYTIRWRRRLHHRDLPQGGVIFDERSELVALGGYERTLTRRFFGLGPDTRERDETDYLEEVSFLGAGLELALPRAAGDWVVEFGLSAQHTNLSRGRVDDEPDTKDVFPELFAAGDRHDSLWVTLGLRLDTRDSEVNPYRGFHLGATATLAPVQTHGLFGATLGLEASWVVAVPGLFHRGGDPDEAHPPTDTVALGARLWWTEGRLPFWALPTLGGQNTLRGFVPNRWTDRAAWHAALEYRFWFIPRGFALTESIRIERIGAALFFEAGSVAARVEKFGTAGIKPSGGLGLRFTLERSALFRADLGFSEDGTNLALGFGVSF